MSNTPILTNTRSCQPEEMCGLCEELEHDACAICFEQIKHATVLPCSCRVAYCTQCWDRALAQSLNDVSQPRCPTCRCPVHVDFDADKGHLVFSRGDSETSLRDLVERLSEQSRPTQLKILMRYGESEEHGKLKELAQSPMEWLQARKTADLKKHITAMGGSDSGCLEKTELIDRLQEVAGGTQALVSHFAVASQAGPKCVCGDFLERLSGKDRAIRSIETHLPGVEQNSSQFQRALLQMASRKHGYGVICDLCDKPCKLSSNVWTCKNGDHTILHASAYDVCDDCFVRHASGLDVPPLPVNSEDVSPNDSLTDTILYDSDVTLFESDEEDAASLNSSWEPYPNMGIFVGISPRAPNMDPPRDIERWASYASSQGSL